MHIGITVKSQSLMYRVRTPICKVLKCTVSISSYLVGCFMIMRNIHINLREVYILPYICDPYIYAQI